MAVLRACGYSRVRACVLLVNEHNEVLLVMDAFGRGEWELPGGGVKRGETARVAAARELREELGLVVAVDELHDMGMVKTNHTRGSVRQRVYTAERRGDTGLVRPTSIEISEARWWPLASLPSDPRNNFREAVEKLAQK